MVVLSKHHVGLAGTYRRAATRALNALLLSGAATCAAYADTQVGQTLPPPPSVLYGDLFVAVQTAQIYPDQKTFVDATPNADPAAIVQLYEQQKNNPGFSLSAFVAQYFTPPVEPGHHAAAEPVAARAYRLALARAHAHDDERRPPTVR